MHFVREVVCLVGFLLMASGCSGDGADAYRTPREHFEACLEEGGYTVDDVMGGDPLSAQEIKEMEIDPGEATEVRILDWDDDLTFWHGRCLNESGVGHSVVGDPDAIAAYTEAVVTRTACMRDHGWDDFPEPVPDPASYSDGLIAGIIEIPQDPEVKDAWTADFVECSEGAGIPVFMDE